MPNRKVALLAAAALAGTLALTGCSNSSESSSPASAPYVGPAGDGAADKAIDPALDPAAAGGGAGADAQAAPPGTGNQAPAPVDQDRSLIYTGTITVKVDSVTAMADRAIAAAIGAGGFVGGDNRVIDEDRSQATLILRVPTERFNSTLDAIAKLGEEESRQIQAQDVTDQIVDLDARVATQEASVNRVRDLLARAQTIADIVSLETELTRRQADLDSLKQRRAKLGGLAELATITAVLHAPAAAGAPEVKPETGFLAGLKDGWDGFLASVAIVLTIAGWLLPWVLAIGLPIWLVLWLLRRRRRPTTPPVTSVPVTPVLAPAPGSTSTPPSTPDA
jgi:hypothetical protein